MKEDILKKWGTDDCDISIISKIFQKEINSAIYSLGYKYESKENYRQKERVKNFVNQGSLTLSKCIKYTLDPNILPNLLIEVKNFLNDNSKSLERKRKLISLLTKSECQDDMKAFLCNFIICSDQKIFKKYLSNFFVVDSLSLESQELLCSDIDNHDVYVRILIEWNCLNILEKIVKQNKSNELIEILKNLYLKTGEKKYLGSLKIKSFSRYLQFCYNEKIPIKDFEFVEALGIIESLFKSKSFANDEQELKSIGSIINSLNQNDDKDEDVCKWIIFWMLKLDIRRIEQLNKLLIRHGIRFNQIFEL